MNSQPQALYVHCRQLHVLTLLPRGKKRYPLERKLCVYQSSLSGFYSRASTPVRYNDVLQGHGTERTAAHGAVSCWMVSCNGRISTKLLRVIWETTAQYTGPHLFYRILTSVKNDIIRLETKVSTLNNFLVQKCRRN
jgi:hypothetical protein